MSDESIWQSEEQLLLYFSSGHAVDEVVDEESGVQLLHEAARRKNFAAVSALISRGADVNSRTQRGDTPLHFCAETACCDIALELLKAGADPNATNDFQETPLHICASSDNCVQLLKLLLQHGANCDLADADEDNGLLRACFEENLDAVRLLLDTKPALATTINAAGFNGLHIAGTLENSDLFGLLLCRGADFSQIDCHGNTPIDTLLANEDTSGIDCLGRFLYKNLSQFVAGQEAVDIISSDQGRFYLQQLLVIDGVREIPPSAPESANRERLNKLNTIISKRKVDPDNLCSELIAAFEEGLLQQLRKIGLLQRCAWKICELILLPQDEKRLQNLVSYRSLWAALSNSMESNIKLLYARALKKKKAGVREMLRCSCTEYDGKSICWQRLSTFIARLTACWQFDNRELLIVSEDSGWTQWHKRPLQDPLQSLVVWAILSSRLKLVPILLRQEQFDMVPLALLASSILRALGRRRDIEDVFAEKASKIADICEGMAIQVLKAVKDVDNSPSNSLTIDYIRLPLPSFGNYTVLDLAARGNTSEFIKLDTVEQTIEKSWYGDFFEFRSRVARELVILCGFVPPLMLLLPRLLKFFRGKGSESFMTSITDRTKQQTKEQVEDQEQQQDKTHQNKTRGAEVERTTLQQDSLERRRRKLSHRINEYMTGMLVFYTTPCVKFRLHAAFNFLLVSQLSYMILHDFQGQISYTETFCNLALLGIFVEEVREMVTCAQQETLMEYLSDGWNVIDIVAFACGFLSFTFRRIDPSEFEIMDSQHGHLDSLRSMGYVLIVTTTLIFWIRMLFIAVVLESVGVKLKMLSLMIKKDFIPFLYILFVVMLGFGIAFHALLWPNATYFANGKYVNIPANEIFFDMFRRTFYTIVGEYGLDDLNECEFRNATNGEDNKCVGYPGSVLVPYVLMVVYIVIVQVLLLNVIVAMFSKTIDMVDSESKSMWLFERYDLTQEFTKRSALPPPLNMLLEARNIAAWLLAKIVSLRGRRKTSVVEILAQNLRNFVYHFYLFYQSVAMRRARRRLDGMDVDEDELSDETVQVLRQLRKHQEIFEKIAASCSSRRSSNY